MAEARKPALTVATVPPALLLIGSTASWLYFEYTAIKAYSATAIYDPSVESISDLSLVYKQVHPLKHHTVHSERAKLLNFGLLLSAALFGAGQLGLLSVTRKLAPASAATARTIRVLLTFSYIIGLAILVNIHGGPREQATGLAGWHWNAWGIVAVAISLNSIVAGLVPGQLGHSDRDIFYRILSVALGLYTAYSYYQFLTLGTWNFRTKIGLWQRSIIYPHLAWQAITGSEIVLAIVGNAIKEIDAKEAAEAAKKQQ
jgi:hypothetical protein